MWLQSWRDWHGAVFVLYLERTFASFRVIRKDTAVLDRKLNSKGIYCTPGQMMSHGGGSMWDNAL